MSDGGREQELIEKLKRAQDVVNGLCNGTVKWRMRVPACPDDTDIVLSEALHEAQVELEAVLASHGSENVVTEECGCATCELHVKQYDALAEGYLELQKAYDVLLASPGSVSDQVWRDIRGSKK